jgi:hypothetical protein
MIVFLGVLDYGGIGLLGCGDFCDLSYDINFQLHRVLSADPRTGSCAVRVHASAKGACTSPAAEVANRRRTCGNGLRPLTGACARTCGARRDSFPIS